MADWDVVRRIALALPGAEEVAGFGHRDGFAWKVRRKSFAWERPLGKNDAKQLIAMGMTPPPDPILGIRTESLDAKEEILASDLAGLFTIPHFNGYAAVLIQLPLVDEAVLEELLSEGWAAMAAPTVVKAWRAAQQP